MECDDLALLTAWIARWTDLVEFDVIPVITSSQASAVVNAGEPMLKPAADDETPPPAK